MGLFEGASQGFTRGVGIGQKMYEDALAEKRMQAQMDRQAQMDAQAQARHEEEMGLKRKELAMKQTGGTGNMQMTPGRKAADMAFGKDYVDFSTGGAATVDKGLNTLEAAKKELVDNGKNITGPIRGAVPDFIRAFTNPEAVGLKERIRGAVQNTLKQTLGAQFTEKEGERIFNNSYNDRLSPEENVKRLDAIIGELKAQKEAKQKMGQYFEESGTLTGYKQPGAMAPGAIEDGYKFLGGDPADPKSWQKVQ